MDHPTDLRHFVEQRAKILERLNEKRAEIDAWLEQYVIDKTERVPALELANFAGLIALSKDFLQELVDLDEAILAKVVQARKEDSGT